MNHSENKIELIKPLYEGFVSGILATITFHQFTLWLLWRASLAPFGPYSFTPTLPWGVPAVISLAFWGGVWGVILCSLLSKASPNGHWVKSFGFGALFPTLVALFIVLPLKEGPIGGGWHLPLLMTAFLINGAWGIGTAAYYKTFFSKIDRPEQMSPTACAEGETFNV